MNYKSIYGETQRQLNEQLYDSSGSHVLKK